MVICSFASMLGPVQKSKSASERENGNQMHARACTRRVKLQTNSELLRRNFLCTP